MTNSTYSGKKTAAVTLPLGVYTDIADSMLPTEGGHVHFLLYVNVSGFLLPGREGGNLDIIAVRNGMSGGTDETAVGDHPVNGRQLVLGADGIKRYAFQAFIPRTWFLARVSEEGEVVKGLRWRIRADKYSIASAKMTTRYGKAWNGR